MSDQLKITLHHPITEEEWDMITDVDFDHTDSVFFHTKHGKEVEFVRKQISKSEALEELVRFIGSWTYGKERWFPQNGVWYDRYDGKYIETKELVARIIKAITDEIAEQT